MRLDICDICEEIIKDILFSVTFKAKIKTIKGSNKYQKDHIKEIVKSINLNGEYDICEGCKKVLDHLFKMRIKEIKMTKRKVNAILKRKQKKKVLK